MDPVLIICDADGTLRGCRKADQPCPNAPGEWYILPKVKERLAQFNWQQTFFAIASNQGGVALGFLTQPVAAGMLYDLVEAVLPDGGRRVQSVVCMCPHPVEMGCNCRKPAPGMLTSACDYFTVPPHRALMVGDMESDRLAADAAGIPFQIACLPASSGVRWRQFRNSL